MKKGQIVEGIVEKIEFPNKGKVYVPEEEQYVIVKNTVPGQKVKCSVNKMRKGKAEGRLLEVTEKSSLEKDSLCPHFGQCGGCTYQNLPYEHQLKLKEQQSMRCWKRRQTMNFSGMESSLHLWRKHIEIRWNSHSEMNIKMVLFLLVCTRKAALTTY